MYRFSNAIFALLVGIFVFISLESLGVTHFMFPSSPLKQTTFTEAPVYNDGNYDFTVVSQSSFERVYFLPFWIERWQGPLSIAFFLYGKGAEVYEEVIKSVEIPSRLNIIAYFSDTAEPYPINKLRNVALRNVRTSHLWLADMDMWPALDLYSTLRNLPVDILRRDDISIIIPAFEFSLPEGTECSSFTGCINNIKDKLPKSKSDVLECVKNGLCSRFRVASHTHSYHFDEWDTLPSNIHVTEVKCMENEIQEPYIVVKRSESLPEFDERFVNYGKNKVQWITHLRLLGYKYFVLSQSFAIDVPHPKSKIAKDWFAEGSTTNWRTKMHIYIDAFTEEVTRQTIGYKIQTPLCSYPCLLTNRSQSA